MTAAAFHPDGHLFAAGGEDGQIKIFNVISGDNAANFDTAAPVTSLDFSENGTWLASASRNQPDVRIWDLRKATQIKSLENGSPVNSVRWDYTGQFLMLAGPQGIAIHQYAKATKQWCELLKLAVPSVAADWGQRAQSAVLLNSDGDIQEMR